MNRNVLISGASIAGPTLAYWLGRHGFNPTVVEIAPALREGGHAVDFRGETHLTVLERMGLLSELRRIQTGGSPMRFVDEAGRTLLHLPAEFAGGEIEVLREDLARVLYERSAPYAEYIFGDSIIGLAETVSGMRVEFQSGASRDFDLVIGADGLHSNVRRLAFGPEQDYVSHLGYYAATWQLPGESYPGSQRAQSDSTRRGVSPPSAPTTGTRPGRERFLFSPRPSCRTTDTTPNSRRS